MIFLVGPTAVGKTEIAIELALKIGGEIVSADSMQIYRGLDLGTAKPTPDERRGVPHHLLDALDIAEVCDVARFRGLALAAIEAVRRRGRVPLVVGGSGLYVRALSRGLCEGPGRDEALRGELEALDPAVLRERLLEADPAAAARIQPHDRRRMVRALEFFRATGRPLSSAQKEWAASPTVVPPFRMIGLARLREDLYRRCDARVDRMFAQGFLEEARGLARRGLAQTPTAGKAIGYADALRFFDGEMDEAALVETVKRRTRNFAKRQLTWFRRETGLEWLECGAAETAAGISGKILRKIEASASSP